MHARDDKLHVNHSAQDGYSRLAQTSSATSSQTSLHSSLEQNDKENHTRDIMCEVGSGQVRSIANKNLTDEVSGVKRKHSESEMSDTVCYFIVSSRGLRGFQLGIWNRFSYYIAIFLRYSFLKPIFQQVNFFCAN